MSDMSEVLKSVSEVAQFTMLTPLKTEENCEICAEFGEVVKAEWIVDGHKLCSKHSIEMAQEKKVHEKQINSTN